MISEKHKERQKKAAITRRLFDVECSLVYRAGLGEEEHAERIWPAVAADGAACLRDENLFEWL